MFLLSRSQILMVGPEARTPRPCCGTLMMASISTPWTMLIPSMPSPSVPTGTGCAPPPAPPSRSGTSRARTWLRSSGLRCPEPPGPTHPSACPLPGVPMARPSLPDTVTTLSVSGRCLLLEPGRSPATKKSPALPLLKKKHCRDKVELALPMVCPLHNAQQAACAHHSSYCVLCAYAALPESCGCNLNKLEGQNLFVFIGCAHQ